MVEVLFVSGEMGTGGMFGLKSRRAKYWAFFSLSHSDLEVTKWLKRELHLAEIPSEFRSKNGRIPNTFSSESISSKGGIRKTIRDFGHIPKYLGSMFLYEDDLNTNSHLGLAVRWRLKRSSSLILICSPKAAQSVHVNSEIEFFKKHGGGERIICVVVCGESKEYNKFTCPRGAIPSAAMLNPSAETDIQADGFDIENFRLPTYLDLHHPGPDSLKVFEVVPKILSSILRIEHGDFTQFYNKSRRSAQRHRRKSMRRWAAAATVVLTLSVGSTWLPARNSIVPIILSFVD